MRDGVSDEEMVAYFDAEIDEAMSRLRDYRHRKVRGGDAAEWQRKLECRQQARRDYQSRIQRRGGE